MYLCTASTSLISFKAWIHKVGATATLVETGIEQRTKLNQRKQYDSNCLIKGGHLQGAAVDVLWDGDGEAIFERERLKTENAHGTGCTLASAIAANLALGCGLRDAIAKAKQYVTEAIRHGLDIGKGNGPTDHFYFLRQ